MGTNFGASVFVAVASAALVLSGCGGGSGGGPASPGSSAPGGRLSSDENVQTERAAAAQATPKEGSVTQSSDTDNSGVTEDVVNVEITGSDPNTLRVRITYNSEEAVDTEDATVRRGVEHVFGRAPGTQFYERFTYEGTRAIEFYRSLDDGNDLGVPAGDLWVDVYTDFGADPDGDNTPVGATDWLAGGIWVYKPASGRADDYEFGAYADGADPYTDSDINSVSGTADYEGGATGVYTDGSSNEFFDADVELMANFNANTISGRVDNFYIDDDRVSGNPVLLLNTASFSSDNFFTSTTSTPTGQPFEGNRWSGKWGGQFYNGSGSQQPGAVAGTFGAVNDNDATESIVGVFGAYKQ